MLYLPAGWFHSVVTSSHSSLQTPVNATDSQAEKPNSNPSSTNPNSKPNLIPNRNSDPNLQLLDNSLADESESSEQTGQPRSKDQDRDESSSSRLSDLSMALNFWFKPPGYLYFYNLTFLIFSAIDFYKWSLA